MQNVFIFPCPPWLHSKCFSSLDPWSSKKPRSLSAESKQYSDHLPWTNHCCIHRNIPSRSFVMAQWWQFPASGVWCRRRSFSHQSPTRLKFVNKPIHSPDPLINHSFTRPTGRKRWYAGGCPSSYKMDYFNILLIQQSIMYPQRIVYFTWPQRPAEVNNSSITVGPKWFCYITEVIKNEILKIKTSEWLLESVRNSFFLLKLQCTIKQLGILFIKIKSVVGEDFFRSFEILHSC